MDLTREQAKAAKACGCAFPTATEAQVARPPVQRRVLAPGGRPYSATRDGGASHGTHATLARLLEGHGRGRAPGEKGRRGSWAAAAAAAVLLAGPNRAAAAADDRQVQGVWMIEDEVALAVADCGEGSLCGRVVWLRTPRDDAGRPKRDAMNPDPALRDRPLCGVTVLDGLLPVPDEPGRWSAGSFYDPRDGRSYGLAATRVSADVLIARVYIGMPFLGVNQTLLRIERASGEGWC